MTPSGSSILRGGAGVIFFHDLERNVSSACSGWSQNKTFFPSSECCLRRNLNNLRNISEKAALPFDRPGINISQLPVTFYSIRPLLVY